jgi:hypothetical protein
MVYQLELLSVPFLRPAFHRSFALGAMMRRGISVGHARLELRLIEFEMNRVS